MATAVDGLPNCLLRAGPMQRDRRSSVSSDRWSSPGPNGTAVARLPTSKSAQRPTNVPPQTDNAVVARRASVSPSRVHAARDSGRAGHILLRIDRPRVADEVQCKDERASPLLRGGGRPRTAKAGRPPRRRLYGCSKLGLERVAERDRRHDRDDAVHAQLDGCRRRSLEYEDIDCNGVLDRPPGDAPGADDQHSG